MRFEKQVKMISSVIIAYMTDFLHSFALNPNAVYHDWPFSLFKHNLIGSMRPNSSKASAEEFLSSKYQITAVADEWY